MKTTRTTIDRLEDAFKALADRTRLRILALLGNPAVTVARARSDTFAGIRPADVPGFIVAQLAGAATATFLFRWLVPSLPHAADRVVVPRSAMSAS